MPAKVSGACYTSGRSLCYRVEPVNQIVDRICRESGGTFGRNRTCDRQGRILLLLSPELQTQKREPPSGHRPDNGWESTSCEQRDDVEFRGLENARTPSICNYLFAKAAAKALSSSSPSSGFADVATLSSTAALLLFHAATAFSSSAILARAAMSSVNAGLKRAAF